MAEKAGSPERVKPPASSTLFSSALLSQIREGKMLKKVTAKEEKERERAQTASGHNVAAILQKRMQSVMGTSDSDESEREYGEEDDWSDD